MVVADLYCNISEEFIQFVSKNNIHRLIFCLKINIGDRRLSQRVKESRSNELGQVDSLRNMKNYGGTTSDK